MANYIVGLTGGIGSGKSAASDYFATLGIDIVDADVIAREVVSPGSSCLKEIVKHFGDHLLDDQGALNRKALRQLVFNNEEHKQWLTNLLHPAIRTRILEQLSHASSPYVILVAPLLLENNLDRFCQRVLVIDVPESLQVQRTLERDQTSAQQVEAIMASQVTREQRLAHADDIVRNDGSLAQLQQQINHLHGLYQQQASSWQHD